ncbi:hypothetical protein PENDEC_c003G00373 [Penicillium decumbens]|uniref:Uncharacterized protein n=1 Tax=Penicillium decumbens TaxID=69771 RepID=A0A1V6PK98_PENDC|nr:hypothetical protein PENDEC_c003G00373 [Penicillium decumbens]
MEKAHPLTSLPTALEMTDVGPDIRWPRFSKRKRQSPTREEQPRDQSLAKELCNEYERKPRNRTRKDRYEYKTAGSSNQISSNADKQKTKRRLRSRKQTMNEGFHASNVARNRLTLPNTANLGIFNRSKASSPIILRDVSNLALSATKRLPREGTRNTWESPTTINKPSKKEANCVYESFNSRNHDILEQRDTSPTKARPEGSTQYLGGRQWTDAMTPQYGLSPSKRPSFDRPKNLVTALQEPRESECQRANSVHKTQSATPYTWSESDQATPSLDPVLRDYLLNVLHVGVPHPGIERYGNSKVYYTLEDLKTLLEARKASWESTASDNQATFRRASSLDLQPEPTAPARGIVGGVPPNSVSLLNTSIGEGNTKLALGKNPEQDVSFSSQHQLDKKEIGSDSLPPDQNPRMVYADINDDNVFIRALDAEFCAIMRPSSKDPEPPRQNSEAHKGLQNVDVYQHTDVYSPDSFDRLLLCTRGRAEAAFCFDKRTGPRPCHITTWILAPEQTILTRNQKLDLQEKANGNKLSAGLW